jgi:hypothetical protein
MPGFLYMGNAEAFNIWHKLRHTDFNLVGGPVRRGVHLSSQNEAGRIRSAFSIVRTMGTKRTRAGAKGCPCHR